MRFVLSAIVLLTILTKLCGQDHIGMPSDEDKCYAKALISDTYFYETHSLPIYTGSDTSIISKYVETRSMLISPAGTKWVQKKADKNCTSADTSDCYVWCLVARDQIVRNFESVLIDSSISKEFYLQSFETREINEVGGYTKWVEVVCDEDFTKELYKFIQEVLVLERYDIGVNKPNGIWNNTSKKAYSAYQQYYNLPIGYFDFETLDHMGVVFQD